MRREISAAGTRCCIKSKKTAENSEKNESRPPKGVRENKERAAATD